MGSGGQGFWREWWTRACGGRDVLRLALPLVISTVSWTIMNFTDRLFLLWYSPTAMAAALPAGMLHFAVLCFPLGVASYANTFVAQYHGAGRPDRIGAVVWQAIYFGLLVTPLILLTNPLAPWVFGQSGHEPAIVELEVIYYQVLSYGAGAIVISAAMSTYFTGRGKTRVVMFVDSSAALLNIVLDYAWVFGVWGFPEAGIAGAAWATVVSLWAKVGAYAWLMSVSPDRHLCQLWDGRRFDSLLYRRMLRFGAPSGFQMLVEVSAATLFVLLVGQLGEEAIVATTLAWNVNAMAFVPMLGLGIAVSTMVGNQLGNNQPDLAARAVWTSLVMAMVYSGIMGLAYVLVPDWFLLGHAMGADPAAFASLRDLTVVLLRFVAAYCLFDTLNIIFVSAIKGAGDMRFVLITSLITAPLPVLAGWAGVRYLNGGLIWCWWVLTAWIVTLGAIYCLRFLQGRWRTMRVIEPEFVVDESLNSAESSHDGKDDHDDDANEPAEAAAEAS